MKMKRLLCLSLVLLCLVSTALAAEQFVLDTEDINDTAVTADLIADAKVVLVNMWEPWCGPCVGEMPDLEMLYENYAEQGLVILGIYSTFEMTEDAKALIEQMGITYPILKMTADMVKYETGYVPTSFLIDAQGNVLSTSPYIGARSYADWEAIVKEYLQ